MISVRTLHGLCDFRRFKSTEIRDPYLFAGKLLGCSQQQVSDRLSSAAAAVPSPIVERGVPVE
jgi:hypothetical protein